MLFLLRLKHWQVFMLTFGLVVLAAIAQFILIGLDSFAPSVPISVLTVTGTFCMLAAAAWFYVAATELHRRLPPELQFNLQQFRLFVIIPAAWNILTMVIPGLAVWTYQTDVDTLATMASLVIGIMNDITIAKALVSVETNRKVTFSDVSGEFFQFLFYPIGVWWLQPRFNRLVDDEPAVDPDAPLDSNLGR